jgi:hypothetical protein
MNPYEVFIKKLDGLAIFQLLSEPDVYEFVKQKYPSGKSDFTSTVSFVEYDYNAYRDFYMNSIFILAYSYFEVFLYDIIFLCLKKHSNIYTILNKIKKINQTENITNDFIKEMLDKIKLTDMRSIIEKDLNLKFNDEHNITGYANLTRNSFLHKDFKVSKKMQEQFPLYIKEPDINKSIVIDNNSLNLAADFVRTFAKTLYDDAVNKYAIDK